MDGFLVVCVAGVVLMAFLCGHAGARGARRAAWGWLIATIIWSMLVVAQGEKLRLAGRRDGLQEAHDILQGNSR